MARSGRSALAEHIAKRRETQATIDLSEALDDEETNAERSAHEMMVGIAKGIVVKKTQKLKGIL